MEACEAHNLVPKGPVGSSPTAATKIIIMDGNIVKEMVERLKRQGVNITYNDNPSKEEVERINSRIKELRNRHK